MLVPLDRRIHTSSGLRLNSTCGSSAPHYCRYAISFTHLSLHHPVGFCVLSCIPRTRHLLPPLLVQSYTSDPLATRLPSLLSDLYKCRLVRSGRTFTKNYETLRWNQASIATPISKSSLSKVEEKNISLKALYACWPVFKVDPFTWQSIIHASRRSTTYAPFVIGNPLYPQSRFERYRLASAVCPERVTIDYQNVRTFDLITATVTPEPRVIAPVHSIRPCQWHHTDSDPLRLHPNRHRSSSALVTVAWNAVACIVDAMRKSLHVRVAGPPGRSAATRNHYLGAAGRLGSPPFAMHWAAVWLRFLSTNLTPLPVSFYNHIWV